ncbi:hypothetical protein V8D89_009801 [Ganoderma adspersum]
MFPIVSEPQPEAWDTYYSTLIFGGQDTYTAALWPCIVLVILSSILLGLFTALALFAALVLVRKGLRHLSNLVLFAVILFMYASAVLHWTTLLLNVIGYYNISRAYAAQLLCQCTNGDTCRALCPVILPLNPSSCTMISFGLPGAVHGLTVVLGDAVVWWRVWVIWPRSLIVRITCVVLLAATLAMGIIDTLDSCSMAAFSVLSVFNFTEVPSGSFYQSDFFGLAASVLSLATNMVATILIGCKAWEHAKIMGSVSSLKRSSRVEKILIFLVESGTVYCVIWVCVLAHQVALLGTGLVGPSEQKVLDSFDYFIKGCLIPLIGMYPTAIITLVALNKSHFHGTSFGGGPVSSISFRVPISTPPTSKEEASLPTVASLSCTSIPQASRIDDPCGPGVEFRVVDSSLHSHGSSRAR